MMDEEAMDRYLGELLRISSAGADEPFVSHTIQLVQVEERMRVARKATWRRFGKEVLTAGAVLTAFLLLGRLAGQPEGSMVSLVSPAAAAMLLLGLWFATVLGQPSEAVS